MTIAQQINNTPFLDAINNWYGREEAQGRGKYAGHARKRITVALYWYLNPGLPWLKDLKAKVRYEGLADVTCGQVEAIPDRQLLKYRNYGTASALALRRVLLHHYYTCLNIKDADNVDE